MKRELTFKNEEQELMRVAEFMENVCDELQIDMHVAMKLQLAMEEMVTNVIFYAYPKGTDAEITLSSFVRRRRKSSPPTPYTME